MQLKGGVKTQEYYQWDTVVGFFFFYMLLFKSFVLFLFKKCVNVCVCVQND